MDAEGILAGLKRFNVPHERIAAAIGRDRTAATKMMNGARSMKGSELAPLAALVAEYEREAGEHNIIRRTDGADGALPDYVQVEVLPTFAGMGGGGTGDGDARLALVPRSLVVHELRADPADLLLIDVRGDSMIDPATGKGFMHGDQLLIHRKDTNPRQPGPFALWFDDGYVVKNVEILRRTGKLRIFSNNPAYSDDEADPSEVRIMGRPVWFARRL
jgi:phage repressor protein C with HTH and peptisase S24 domain